MSDTSINVSKISELKLPSELKTRLRKKFIARNEDLILDYLEQIEIHKSEINKLVKKVNELTNSSYLSEDGDIQETENQE